MKTLTRISLLTSAAAVGLLTAVTNPAEACLGQKLAGADNAANPTQPIDFSSKTPDFKAMGIALTGLGLISAALAAAGLALRQRQLERQAATAEIAIAEETFVDPVIDNDACEPEEIAAPSVETEEREWVMTR